MSLTVYRNTDEDINNVSKLLNDGELVAIPTETVYGLAAHALNEKAVSQIFKIKGRPLIDPLIVHIDSLESASIIAEICHQAEKLAEAFWPGPLSIIMPKKPIIPNIVTAGLQSIAIRCPAHPLLRKVLIQSKLPLAAPSANPFGYISPTEAKHVIDSLGDRIEHLLDGGPCEIGLESTILDLQNPSQPQILRPGSINRERIEEVLKTRVGTPSINEGTKNAIKSPGTLKSHYSPRTRLCIGKSPIKMSKDHIGKIALLYLKRPTAQSIGNFKNKDVFWSSENGDLNEVARNLFRQLRILDNMNYDIIIAEPAPSEDIGIAINDRLQRAAAS